MQKRQEQCSLQSIVLLLAFIFIFRNVCILHMCVYIYIYILKQIKDFINVVQKQDINITEKKA